MQVSSRNRNLDHDPQLTSPGTARANTAASAEHPDGTKEDDWAAHHQHQTVSAQSPRVEPTTKLLHSDAAIQVLQQHINFFDPDGDGVIWPLDSLLGLHKLGFNWLLSTLAALVIHAQFSYPTQPTYLPDPAFRIYSANIHKTKHGSDTDTYDNEGRFIPQKFEDIFSKYAQPGKDSLSFWDMCNALKGQRLHGDPFGWANAFAECTANHLHPSSATLLFVCLGWLTCGVIGMATYLMLWPEDGEMKKDDLRRVYDGSLFYTIAERRAAKQKKHD